MNREEFSRYEVWLNIEGISSLERNNSFDNRNNVSLEYYNKDWLPNGTGAWTYTNIRGEKGRYGQLSNRLDSFSTANAKKDKFTRMAIS